MRDLCFIRWIAVKSTAALHIRSVGYSHYPVGRFLFGGKILKIEFKDEKDLAYKILESDIDIRLFGIHFMDAIGISLCRTHQDRLEYVESKRRSQKADMEKKFDEWGNRVLCEDDIPEWVKRSVHMRYGADFHSAAHAILDPYKGSSLISKEFLITRNQYYFSPSGLIFLLFSMKKVGWITSNEYYRWRDESGISE